MQLQKLDILRQLSKFDAGACGPGLLRADSDILALYENISLVYFLAFLPALYFAEARKLRSTGPWPLLLARISHKA